jgi:hypothetical protein
MSVSGFNNAADMTIDVHIAVLPPGGGIYEVPDWNTAYTPLLRNVLLPTGFDFPKCQLASYALTAFPFTETGSYLFAAAFMQPWSLDFVGYISFAPFEVQQGSTEGWTAGVCNLERNYSYNYQTGVWQTIVDAGAVFGKYAQKPDYYVDYWNLPEDACAYSVYNPLEQGYPTFLDAGDHIDMLGAPRGTCILDRTTSSEGGVTIITYSPGVGYELGESDYVAGTTYRFEGYGGPDVGAFDESVQAPQAVEIYTPDLSSRPTINRGSDLHLTWNGIGQGDIQFYIVFDQIDISTMSFSIHTCYCRFADDGDAIVPSSVLSQMPPYTNPLLPPPEMGMTRMNFTEFSADGLQNGIVVAMAGTLRDVNLQ